MGLAITLRLSVRGSKATVQENPRLAYATCCTGMGYASAFGDGILISGIRVRLYLTAAALLNVITATRARSAITIGHDMTCVDMDWR